MATPLGNVFPIDEKVVAQVGLKPVGSTVESLVIEFDLEKFKQLLSSGSVSPKSIRKYRKVSSETRSLPTSEASQGKAFSNVNRTLFDKAISSTSLAVCATFLKVRGTPVGANTTCDEVSQETRKTSVVAQD